MLLGQFVKLMRGDEEVRLSKRAGNIITLADILDEVDADVVRMTFLLISLDSPQTFDLAVVTSQSMENPVYYVQYAHARGSRRSSAGPRKPASRGGRSPTSTSAGSNTSGSTSCCARSTAIPRWSPTRPTCARRKR